MSLEVRKWGILSYRKCQELCSGRKLGSLKLGPNTYLYRNSSSFEVRFHGTVIIEYEENGAILLYTGGHRTTTTKQRLNAFLPYHIYQKAGVWYVDWNGCDLEFYEGINVGTPQTEREAMERAAHAGDEVALAMLNDYLQDV